MERRAFLNNFVVILYSIIFAAPFRNGAVAQFVEIKAKAGAVDFKIPMSDSDIGTVDR
jgi:hypothetical protein